MKIHCHIYNRAEGKTTDAVEEALLDAENIVLVPTEQSRARLRQKMNNKVFSSFDNLRGLHPPKVIIDEAYAFYTNPKFDLYTAIQKSGLDCEWSLYFSTTEEMKKVILNPESLITDFEEERKKMTEMMRTMWNEFELKTLQFKRHLEERLQYRI